MQAAGKYISTNVTGLLSANDIRLIHNLEDEFGPFPEERE